MEFTSLGFSGSGHSRQLVVHPEVILNGDGGIGLGLFLYRHAFLGFDRLVQSVAPPSTRHQATGVLIDDHNLAPLHDVLLVLFVKAICTKQLRNRMNPLASNLKDILTNN